MTLAAEVAKAGKQIIPVLAIELKYRIDAKAWTQCDAPNTSVFWMDHLAEGAPSRVRECDRATHLIVEYAAGVSIAACQATAKTKFYDSSDGKLYVHTTNGNAPSTAGAYYLSSHFWERWCARQLASPNEIICDGQWAEPRLAEDSVGEVNLSATPFSEGGIQQSFGSVKIQNADGRYDAWLDYASGHYIWSACPIVLMSATPGDDWATIQAQTMWRGWTGNVGRDDNDITIDIEDERRIAE